MATPTLNVMRPIQTLDDYYNQVMDQYAEAGDGLLARLVPGCPVGDFAHTPYKWTKAQQLAWKVGRQAPCHINDIPANPSILLQSFHIPAEADRIRSRAGTIINVTTTNDISDQHKKKTSIETFPVINIRISKASFLRLEQITHPGIRIWLTDSYPPHFLAIPSHLFEFTEEEKTKYRENRFKKDGSDLPTVEGLVERYRSSGMGEVWPGRSVDNGADVMRSFYDYYGEQEAKLEKEKEKEIN